MKLKDIMEKIAKHSEFKDWEKDNKDCFLAHAFMMMDQANANIWQIGFHNPKNDKVTTFILEGDNLKISPELDVFKKPDSKVHKLDIEKVKIGSVQAIETAEGVMAKEYPKTVPSKMFFIIQELPEHGTIYNITFVTHDFKTVNVKVSSEDGKVIHHAIENLLEFKK